MSVTNALLRITLHLQLGCDWNLTLLSCRKKRVPMAVTRFRAGQGLEQPGIMGGVSAHGMELEFDDLYVPPHPQTIQ